MSYAAFLAEKAQVEGNHGFSPVWVPPFLFDFQAAMVEWATLKGRAAIFEDCGLGKTVQELVWSENVVRHTGGNVLLLTPLAVARQIEEEAEKFGVRAKVSRDGTVHPGITITKPKIGAWGLNYQHCNHVTFFPSHSFEQYYQGVRRCWRFGQTRPVTVDIVTTEGERGVLRNLQRKQSQADDMFTNLVAEMNSAMSIARQSNFSQNQEIPKWLSTIKR
jgi:SNF2 family DNA or RNA helicase